MAWQKLTGLAALERISGETGDQLHVRVSANKQWIIFVPTTALAVKMSPEAARHLAACLLAAAKEVEVLSMVSDKDSAQVIGLRECAASGKSEATEEGA